jgi:transcriptional regulator with XRE-family HTH domain
MLIGQRLRDIRDAKNLSQDDIERSTGLVRPYISRVENGHTVPSIETLQKWAAALRDAALSSALRWRGTAQTAKGSKQGWRKTVGKFWTRGPTTGPASTLPRKNGRDRQKCLVRLRGPIGASLLGPEMKERDAR